MVLEGLRMERRKEKSIFKTIIALFIGAAAGYAIRGKRNNLYFEILVKGKTLAAEEINLLDKSFGDIKLEEID